MDEQQKQRLARALLVLRASVALVFLIWVLDKFVNPAHAQLVFTHFYSLSSMATGLVYLLGVVQLVIVLAFVFGIAKTCSYLAVLIMHAASTVVTIPNLLSPWQEFNILFYAGVPMLAACWVLWSLREYDTLFSFGNCQRLVHCWRKDR